LSYKSREHILPYTVSNSQRNFGKDTLDTLENDDSYIKVAERFLSSIGEDDRAVDDVYEYLRDEDWNLGASAKRSLLDIPSFTDQQKKDYVYLRQRFDNADMGGFKQYLGFIADAGVDLATDPVSLAAVIAAPFTGGASATGLFANRGLAQAAKLGLKKVGKSFKNDKSLAYARKDTDSFDVYKATGELDWGATLKKGKMQRQEAVKQYYKDKAKNTALFGAAEGVLWTGADEYLRQERESIDGIDIREGLNLYDVGTSSLIGGVLGGALGKGLSNVSTAFSKEAHYNLVKFSDESYVDENSLGFKASKAKDAIISKTVGKPVTRFLTLAESSQTMQTMLKAFRYDTYKFKEGRGSSAIGSDYHSTLSNYNGKYHQAYEDIIRPLAPKGKINKDDELILSRLMRRKDFKVKVEGATDVHYKVAAKVRKLADSVLKDGAEVGVYRRPLNGGVNSWFPRRWLWEEVQGNRRELADIMVKSDAVSLDDTTMLSLLPEGANRRRYEQLTNLTNAYEEILTDLPSKNKEDLESFVEGINRKYNVSASVDGLMLENPTASFRLGNLMQKAAKEKKEIERTLPPSADVIGEKTKVANQIIDDMLSKKNEVNTLDIETLGTVMPSSFSPRKLFMLDDFEIEKFIASDFDLLMRDYFNQSSRLYARKSTLGIDLNEFNQRWIKPAAEELAKKGVTLNNADKEQLAKMYNFTTGLDQSNFGSNGLNIAGDFIKVSQQLAHLPLVTLSSLTEIFIPLTRTNAATWARGMGQTLKFAVQRTSDNTLRELQDRHKLSKEDALAEMHRVFLGINQAVAQRIDGLAGEGVQSVVGRKIQNGFFKVNLLEQWTRTVQLASFTMGKDLITRNLKEIVALEATPNAVNKKKVDRLEQELLDLGINIEDGKRWVQKGANTYTPDFDKDGKIIRDEITGLRKWDSFYEKQVMGGAARFTNEVILDPSKAASIRPHVQQTPMGTILFQFLGYPTAFTNTVLKNFYGQASRDPVRGGAKILSTGLLMTAAAAGTNWIRNGGNFKNYKGEEQENDEIIMEAVQRWGGIGFFDYAERARSNAEIGGGFLGSSVKAVTGPIVGDAIDGLIYRKGPGELLATNVPGYSLYRSLPSLQENRDLKKDIQEFGKDIDRAVGLKPPKKEQSLNAWLETQRSYYQRSQFFKGGELDQEVPRTGLNPSQRVDRTTGMPYSDQSGELLNNRRQFMAGSIVKAVRKQGSKFFTYLDESSEELFSTANRKDRIDAHVRESQVKTPVYFSVNPNGLAIAETNPSVLSNPRGTIRTLNPFKYSGKIPKVTSLTNFLDQEDFITQVSKSDAELAKSLKRIQKERERLPLAIEEGLGYSPDQIALHPILVEKEIIDAFKTAGYDSIQHAPVNKKDLSERFASVESTRIGGKAPVRTAGETVQATVTNVLEEAERAMPGSREALAPVEGTSGMQLKVDELPDEPLVEYEIPTKEYIGLDNYSLTKEMMEEEKNWILLDDTMFLESSNIPVLDKQTYFNINTQFSEKDRIDFINETKFSMGLSDEKFKNDIAKGPYHLVTSLLPSSDVTTQNVLEDLPSVKTVYGPLPNKNKEAFAYYDKKQDTVFIDPVRMREAYDRKAWTSIRKDVLEKKPGAEPLPENSIDSLEDWNTFVVRHEYAHAKYSIKEGESAGEYENRMNRIALGIPEFLPSKILTIEAATPERLAKLAGEINLNDEGQKAFYDSLVNQLKVREEKRQASDFTSLVDPQLYFMTEMFEGQASKYLSDDLKLREMKEARALTGTEMAAFIKERQANKPAEFLHHPVNNNIRNSVAKAFASISPPVTSVKEAQDASIDYMNKVVVTEEQPYTPSQYFEFEKKTEMDKARVGESTGDDPELGIMGFREDPELESYNPKTDRVFPAKQNGKPVTVMSTTEGDFLVTRENENAPYEFVLKDPDRDPLFQYTDDEGNLIINRVEYIPPKQKSKKSKKKKPRVATTAKFKTSKDSVPAITQELPMLRKKSELSESITNLAAFKEADPVQQQRILDLIDKNQKRGNR